MTIDKVYDGSELFTSSSSAKFSGMVANEAAPRLNSGSAKVGSAQAATYPIFTTSNLGVDNPNYTLNGAPVVATIQKAPLGVRAEGNYTGTTEIKPINFSVIGLVNNETLTALEKFLVSVKEVQANDTNFVTELVKAGGGGSADLANYKLNPATSTLDDATQNSVKIRALSTLILTTPAAPSVLPKVREAPGNVRTPAPVKIEEAAVIGSPAAVAVEVPVRATVTTEPAATLAPASVGSNNESGNAATSGTIKTGDVNASPDKESEANCSVGNSVQSGPGAACLRN
jgi:uncharacterized protein with FMN-binding domain